ncbi:universal stress protein [Roseiarcaceae bacterium H3SJ34-1]|uniref:universal stress protein n=1 Tax=Terripilifer ovatus TaxID=3032367 RepID=UPI003AB922CC|nr:universal stress protein [Roseiarcaceae bacterium H3SJ34-1]
MFKRVFLPMVNYPFPTLPSTIRQALSVTQFLRAELSVLSLEVVPPFGLGYANYTMPFVGTVISAEEAKAAANREAVADDLLEQARQAGVPHILSRQSCSQHEVADRFAAFARFCDLSVLPAGEDAAPEVLFARSVVFGSGHPCLILPRHRQTISLRRAVIAWDGSRAAIRSIADALPILEKATDVLVVTAAPDKVVEKSNTANLIYYLHRHGIAASPEVIEIGERSAAEAISHRAQTYAADCLVMGAFGHSQLRDLILGGVTQHMLAYAPLPVFLSF